MINVLLVDDEEIVCRGMAKFVKWEDYGFEVRATANNATDCLTVLKSMHIDVVFLDINMPDKNGLDLLPEIKELYPDIYCIILSGYSDFSYVRTALLQGVYDYLVKPVAIDDLQNLLLNLARDYEERSKTAEIDSSRKNALLLSLAKGGMRGRCSDFGIELPTTFLGLFAKRGDSDPGAGKQREETDSLKQTLGNMVTGSVILEDDISSLFAILPFDKAKNPEEYLESVLSFCTGYSSWYFGCSDVATSEDNLTRAYNEALSAMRYAGARNVASPIFYRNIVLITGGTEIDTEEISKGLVDSVIRGGDEIRKLIEDALFSVKKQSEDFNLFRAFVIRLTIDVFGRLNIMGIRDEGTKNRLNDSLSAIISEENPERITQILVSLFEGISSSGEGSGDGDISDELVKKIKLYIRSNYMENISLKVLSEKFYLHPNYLSSIFKEKSGENYISYLTDVRIERAKDFLKDKNLKVHEIASMVGYDNPRYFGQLFKQITGKTCQEYRASL